MKRELTVRENILANDTSLDKGSISKLYKELIWLNTRRTINLIKKWAKDLNRHLSKEDIQRAQGRTKGCAASLVITEMQIKTTMKYYFTLVRMAITNKSTNNKCWWDCGEKGTLVHCWWDCRLGQPLWKTVWNFLKKLKRELPYDPVILLLEIYHENTKIPIQKNWCTPMLIAKLFTIAKYWK